MVEASPTAKRRSDLLSCDRLGVWAADMATASRSPDAFSQHLVHEMAGIGLHPESDVAPASSVRLPEDTAFLGKILNALVDQVLELCTDICQHLGRASKAVGLA
jgi:hypothetical protein